MATICSRVLHKYLTSNRHDDLLQQRSLLSNDAQQTSRDLSTPDVTASVDRWEWRSTWNGCCVCCSLQWQVGLGLHVYSYYYDSQNSQTKRKSQNRRNK